jgi:hypothetical protein
MEKLLFSITEQILCGLNNECIFLEYHAIYVKHELLLPKLSVFMPFKLWLGNGLNDISTTQSKTQK